MAPSHVPNEQLPIMGQNMYTDPSYENLFPSVDQFATSSPWNPAQPNHHHPGLVQQHQQGVPAPNGASWHHNLPQSYASISQPYGGPQNGYQTASPYQYGQFGNHGTMGSYATQPNVDPSLVDHQAALRQQQQSPYQMPMRNVTPQAQPNTVAPQALQQQHAAPPPRPISAFQVPKSTSEMFTQRATPTLLPTQPMTNARYGVPKGKALGGFSVVDRAALVKSNTAAINQLVNIGSRPLNLATNRTTLPQYAPRQSVKDLKKAAAGNRKLLDRIASKPASTRVSLPKGAAGGRGGVGSPSGLKREASSSDDYTDDSDDESEYTDDEEEVSPLPQARPEEPQEAVRYDIIKATWFPKRSQPNSEKIKDSLRDIWEVLNTIQKRWRIDSKAVAEAEDKKMTGELPVLKSRVKSQRDLLQGALKTALDFAHVDVLYHLGQVKPFLYLCYQFLANRFKVQDYDGGLPTAIYEILARCVGTLTTETLEETKTIKALNSMRKGANERTKALIQQIIDGAAANSKKAKPSTPPQDVEQKTLKRPQTDGPLAKKVKTSESVSSTKRAPIAMPPKTVSTPTNVPQQKRPGEKPAAVPVKARQVVNKPSSFFSTLNVPSKKPAAAPVVATPKPTTQSKSTVSTVKEKKPATTAKPSFSFAETMAQLLDPKKETTASPKPEKQLPPETPEEKAKRLRKESRRHLRVKFRPDSALVSIRIFHHEPEEDLDHDDNLVRDAGDIGGEGRMFKQHKDMEFDEDEDEPELRPWIEPTVVDFSRVELEERQRNYEPYGGGKLQPTCPDKEANQLREKGILMVIYSRHSSIPPSPREPTESNEPPPKPVIEFGPPPQLVLDRSPKQDTPPAPVDVNALQKLFAQYAVPTGSTPQAAVSQTSYAPPQVPVVPFDASLFENLRKLQEQAPPPAPVSAPPVLPPMPPVPVGLPAGLDLTALLAQLQPPTGAASYPPPPPGWPTFPPSFAQAFQQPQQPAPTGFYEQPQQPATAGFYKQQQPAQYEQNFSGGNKRARDDSSERGGGYGSFKKQKPRGNQNKFDGDRPHKVVPCKFFQEGKCTKGDSCTFIHDRS
ncbi:hypothetical protein P154DRAFT_428519 [Amniculicola lignicola CBS 123094]|uniref:C3H1-type domain-containing protein n=1 Tax=Amniculicola lignicola CBS 123094 TaxID=1392246 RepID=A0A6A5WPE3_9PLEO|nr:hypothetical protein P154DRAFT_428519 [Amniculicola lignicola CBS 123094]